MFFCLILLHGFCYSTFNCIQKVLAGSSVKSKETFKDYKNIIYQIVATECNCDISTWCRFEKIDFLNPYNIELI